MQVICFRTLPPITHNPNPPFVPTQAALFLSMWATPFPQRQAAPRSHLLATWEPNSATARNTTELWNPFPTCKRCNNALLVCTWHSWTPCSPTMRVAGNFFLVSSCSRRQDQLLGLLYHVCVQLLRLVYHVCIHVVSCLHWYGGVKG